VLTSIVPPPHVPNAVALNSLQFNLSRAIGPAFAALLLARAGIGACLAANAVSYMAVITAVWRIEVPPRTAIPPQSLRRSLLAGIAHVWGSPVLRPLTLLGAAASFLGFPLVTYLPVLAGDVLGTGASGYSLLLSSFGAGAIGGALATAHRAGVPRRGGRVLVAFTAYGLFALAAVSSRHRLVSTALLFAAGWSLVTAFSTLNSLVQEHAADALKGRILSIYGVAFRGGMPFGSLVAGLAVAPFGVAAVIGTFSLSLAVLAAAVYARDPGIREL
jgi:predicted MFS family arabinose efflux permease